MDAVNLLDVAASCLAMVACWVAYALIEHGRGK